MTELSLDAAQTIIAAALDHGRQKGFEPLCVVVLDARGAVKASAAADGASLARFQIAHGKAYGCVAFGLGNRELLKRAQAAPHFTTAVGSLHGVAIVPVPGGVLLRDSDGRPMGAVGISGDTSENDEAAALAGIAATGLTADIGA